ncbi:CRISPR-associated endoribonuclease Cas6 [Cronbergia sp. UHCC 0137]|uniref:CRISPR-associated endoribonuclease Cas6 n=1 Tax=Cronbergia sp. UHCC 0137 TaxID=3110239 RepID=UPI002B20CC92|nr:CRISPR-associated endoribonuclease Cas6 [Cronbergia sp. UHCC 0137]MEA5616750.1 CRISPR-associated endoribonuclease Cas6 [Cronbergia sp. UHCC 0137]
MARSSQKKINTAESELKWADDTELVGLEFDLVLPTDTSIYPQYTIGLHAWFLDQVRSLDPELSAYLHDSESEKPFTISALDGDLVSSGRQIQLSANNSYRWYVTALSQRVVQWMKIWLENLPGVLNLRHAEFKIRGYNIVHPPMTYTDLLNFQHRETVTLKFLSPTSFRRKGHHFPLPLPVNVFHSYLRRWNDFSGNPVDQETFLAWVDENVLINRHQISSVKVLAGKKGAVTGFTGAIEYCLTKEAASNPEFQQLFYALGQLAPYCGTGHKTTFGLGQTRLGWLSQVVVDVPDVQSILAKRIEDLTEIFKAQRQRQGGERAEEIAAKWATILARRELGESLLAIAQDLEMPYQTVKTYAKLSRQMLKDC